MNDTIAQKPEEIEENTTQTLPSPPNQTAISNINSCIQEEVNFDAIANPSDEATKNDRATPTNLKVTEALKSSEISKDSSIALYSLATWLVISLFIVIQMAIISQSTSGPFFDEGIYITAGFRTLAGFGISDQYTTWFAGSLLWPVLAAFGYKAGGLLGVRLVALVCTSLALAATAKAAQNLFGRKVGFWTASSLAVSGPTLALGHLGVYDVVALAGIGVSFWATTELNKHDDRRWLILATVAFNLAVLAKYPTGLCLIFIIALIFVLRGKRAKLDAGIFGFISLALLMIYYLLLREQVAQFFPWRLENNPSFGATLSSIWSSLIYVSFVPAFLAGAGWIAAPKKRRIALILLLALTIWPIYHLLAGNVVSANKHVVFGYLFAYPLVGLALATLARRWIGTFLATLCLLILAIFGYEQMTKLDSSWPDVRNTAQYLTEKVQPGSRLLINNSWPYTMYLYTEGRIDDPWKVYDAYRIEHDQEVVELCEFDWLVNEEGVYSWSAAIQAKIEACGTFEEVYVTINYITNPAQNFQFITNPVRTTIWHNVRNEVKP